MEYIASVRNKETGKQEVITMDYPTKKAFEIDLRGNGYSIRFITTEANFDEDCSKWYENNEKVKRVEKFKHEYAKEQAQKYGCSVTVYKKAYKTWMEKDAKGEYKYTSSLEDWIEFYSKKSK